MGASNSFEYKVLGRPPWCPTPPLRKTHTLFKVWIWSRTPNFAGLPNFKHNLAPFTWLKNENAPIISIFFSFSNSVSWAKTPFFSALKHVVRSRIKRTHVAILYGKNAHFQRGRQWLFKLIFFASLRDFARFCAFRTGEIVAPRALPVSRVEPLESLQNKLSNGSRLDVGSVCGAAIRRKLFCKMRDFCGKSTTLKVDWFLRFLRRLAGKNNFADTVEPQRRRRRGVHVRLGCAAKTDTLF